MIRKRFDIKGYWKVIVYANINYNFFSYIAEDINKISDDENIVDRIYNMMYYGKAKAFTVSNKEKHISIIGINKTNNVEDFVNSIVHECEHVKQAILSAYNVKDVDENAAYTVGYIVSKVLLALL